MVLHTTEREQDGEPHRPEKELKVAGVKKLGDGHAEKRWRRSVEDDCQRWRHSTVVVGRRRRRELGGALPGGGGTARGAQAAVALLGGREQQ
jgi:hypothetical protein